MAAPPDLRLTEEVGAALGSAEATMLKGLGPDVSSVLVGLVADLAMGSGDRGWRLIALGEAALHERLPRSARGSMPADRGSMSGWRSAAH